MIFYSHKGILLKDHLHSVGETAKLFVKNLDLKYKNLSDIADIIGKVHDIGKYTSFFQKHLNGEKVGSKAHHSMISALIGANIIKNYLNNHIIDIDISYQKFLPLISYLIIYKHHGDLKSPDEIIPSKRELKDYPDLTKVKVYLREEIIIASKQLDDIKRNSNIIQKEIDELGLQFNILDFTEEKFLEIFQMLSDLKYELLENEDMKESERLNIYFLTLLLYSALIDADKKTAGREEVLKTERRNIPSNLVDKYIEEKFKENKNSIINIMRSKIYYNVTKKVGEINLEDRLFTLTAPTGFGKTLTALSFALKLREKIKINEGFCPRIIYSLPFVNIIEQNYDVFYDVLKLLPDFEKNFSSYLIKHHHLSSVVYKENDESKSIEESLLLIESWESEIIITTFIQFLHSVIAFKNSFLKKFHNIAGSIIILDEVQNIPVEYWDLVNKVLQGLVNLLGCRIILMTATKPLLFYESSKELLEEKIEIFRMLNRVVLKPQINSKITDDKFIEEFYQILNTKSCLIVLNTISKSIDIYNILKEKLKCEGFIEFEKKDNKYKKINFNEDYNRIINRFLGKKVIFYLSTNITPIQRDIRIKTIKKLIEKGEKPIVVSTQVVEAGVDLDFEVVFRDIGPLDSIVQVAGRCNRNYALKNEGEVFVLNFENGYAEKVYGKLHLFITSKLLESSYIYEKDFLNLVEKYFPLLKERSDSKSDDILKAIYQLNFKHDNISSISDFKLIEEEGSFLNIFIEIDEDAIRIKDKFISDVINEKDLYIRKNSYYQLRKDFTNYLISIRDERIKNNLIVSFDNNNFYYVSYNLVDACYDLETGYKRENLTVIF
jgi:CRISPR-associated endonuclease/helicase Cas3